MVIDLTKRGGHKPVTGPSRRFAETMNYQNGTGSLEEAETLRPVAQSQMWHQSRI